MQSRTTFPVSSSVQEQSTLPYPSSSSSMASHKAKTPLSSCGSSSSNLEEVRAILRDCSSNGTVNGDFLDRTRDARDQRSSKRQWLRTLIEKSMISSSNPSSHQSVVSLTLERQEDKQHQTAPHIATLSSSKLLTRGSSVVVDQSEEPTTLCRLRNRFPLARCSDDDSSQVCKKVWFTLGFSYGPPYICKYFER